MTPPPQSSHIWFSRSHGHRSRAHGTLYVSPPPAEATPQSIHCSRALRPSRPCSLVRNRCHPSVQPGCLPVCSSPWLFLSWPLSDLSLSPPLVLLAVPQREAQFARLRRAHQVCPFVKWCEMGMLYRTCLWLPSACMGDALHPWMPCLSLDCQGE